MSNLFYQPKLSEGVLQLDPDESSHAIKVLRHKPGDLIKVTDGRGTLYTCEIVDLKGKACSFIVTSHQSSPRKNYSIQIAISPTKASDRIDWFVEKSTEIGVQKISFIQTERTERSRVNTQRIRKIAVSAMKQSNQCWLPEVEDISYFESFLHSHARQKFIAYLGQSTQPLSKAAEKSSDYLILIGPEGDFTEHEIGLARDNNFILVSLGSTTLRTETAGVVACQILNQVNLSE